MINVAKEREPRVLVGTPDARKRACPVWGGLGGNRPEEARRLRSTPSVCCPTLACPARGQTGQGISGLHSCQDKRCLCTACHKTCSATTGTALGRLHTAAETLTLVVTVLAPGCPPHAIVAAFGCDERTGTRWRARGGGSGQAVPAHLVEQPRALGQVQADALRGKQQGGMVWMAWAMLVRTRLGRAGTGASIKSGQWLERHSVSGALDTLLRHQDGMRARAGLLTPRELEIVRLVARGLRNKGIADARITNSG